MADNETKIGLGLDTDGFKQGLKDAVNSFQRFASDVNKSIRPIASAFTNLGEQVSKGFGDGFSSIVKGVTVANLASDAIQGTARAVKDFVVGSIQAAQEEEDAINRLSQALRASGSFSQQAVDDFSAFASQLQRTSLFADDVVLSQLALAKSFGATNSQAKELVQAAANLSATFGGSLEENLQKLGKTLSGTAGRLGQFIPELKGLTKEQLAAGDAADIINSKFAGAAQAQLDTFSGRVTALSNAYSDFQEVLGGTIINSDVVQGSLKLLSDALTSLADKSKQAAAAQKATDNGFVDNETELNALTQRYADLSEELDIYSEKVKNLPPVGNAFDTALQRTTELKKELKILEIQVANSSAALATVKIPETNNKPNKPVLTESELETRRREQEQILAQRAEFNTQLMSQEIEFQLAETQLRLQNQEIQSQERLALLNDLETFELQKIEIIRQAEIEKANLIKDEANKALAITNANRKAELAGLQVNAKKTVEAAQVVKRNEMQVFSDRIRATQDFIGAGLALTKQGSKEQQSLAIANALVSTFAGAANALKTQPFVPAGLAAFSLALTTGFGAIANIRSQRFQDGGIVPGNNLTGDTINARLNSREMVLNQRQQAELFNLANGRSVNSNNDMQKVIEAIKQMPIVVVANGREIARLVRDERQNGFAV